jgi:thioredoxin-related protein
MKKGLLIIIFVLSILLTSCSNKELLNSQYDFKAYYEGGSCDDVITQVAEDVVYTYYFPCSETDFYTFEDIDGNEYNLYQVLFQELLSISQVYELLDGHLLRESIDESVGSFDYDHQLLIHIVDQNVLLTQPEEVYYIYFYSLTCSHCNSIKEEMIEFVINSDNLYYYSSIQDLQSTNGIPTYLEVVPTLVKVENGLITETVTGVIEIREHIDLEQQKSAN